MAAPVKNLWDQKAFEKLEASWPKARREKDGQRLNEIFRLAALSPTLRQALVWAEAHGVHFFIDHRAVNCGGYYTPGTGVVALTKKTAEGNPYFAVQALAHEIRHAWQDCHGLCPTDFPGPATTSGFSGYFVQLALVEADAYAFGKRAEDELLAAKVGKHVQLSKGWQDALADEGAELRKKFLDWFLAPGKTRYYGDAASKGYASGVGIYSGAQPQRNFEFTAPEVAPLGQGPDIADGQRLLALGKTFSGGNYLAGLSRDTLLKKILAPSLALSFYEAANDSQQRLTAEIRKYDLRQKLSFRRQSLLTPPRQRV